MANHNCPFHIGTGKTYYHCSVATGEDGKPLLCGCQRYCTKKGKYVETSQAEKCRFRLKNEEK